MMFGVEVGAGILLELGIIILLVTILGLFASLLKQPMLPVYILAGLLINYLSSHEIIIFDKVAISSLSELGIAFLLFLIGMEFDIDKIRNILTFAVVGTTIQLFLTSLFIFLILKAFSFAFSEALLIAVALSFSSTAIVVKYLSDKGTLDTIYGRNALSMLLMQDIFVILILPFLIPSPTNVRIEYHIVDIILKGAGLIALAFTSNRFLIRPLLKKFYNNVDITFLLSLSILFVFSIVSSIFGFSIAIGGFIGGLAMAVYPYSYRVTQHIAHLRDFFIVLFFVTLGLQMSLSSLTPRIIAVSIFLIGFTLFIKPFFYILPSMMFGNDAKNSLQLGITLSQTSEFSLILGGIALSSGIISPTSMALIGTVFFVTSFFSSYLIQWSWVISSKLYKYLEFLESLRIINPESEVGEEIKETRMRDHIIIYGINAFTKILLEKLDYDKILVLSDDVHEVRVLRKEGYNVIFGSIDDEEVLKHIHIDKARIFIYAEEDFQEVSEGLATLKSLNKHIKIIGRCNDFRTALKLYEGGVDFILIDGKHNYEDLKKVVEALLHHDKELFVQMKNKELEYLTKEMEKEVLALHLPEELSEIKNAIIKSRR